MSVSLPTNERRIVVALIAVLVLVQLVALGLSRQVNGSIAQDTVADQLEAGERFLIHSLKVRQSRFRQAARVLARDYGLRETVALGDSATTESMLANHQARIGASFITVLGTEGGLQATIGLPASDQTIVMADLLESAQARGEAMSRSAIGRSLFELFAVPVKAPSTVAWLILGFEIDDETTTRLAEQTGIEIVFAAAPTRARDENVSGPANGPADILSASLDELAWRDDFLAVAAFDDDRASEQTWGRELYWAKRRELDSVGDRAVHVWLGKSLSAGLAPFEELQSQLSGLTLLNIVISIVGIGSIVYGLVGPINRLAYLDQVTGLGNRTLFREKLASSLEFCAKEGKPVSLLYLDLDRFKVVNDTHGHAVGDRLLELVGKRLAALIRKSDTVARIGGDEFAVILNGAETGPAMRVAESIVRSLGDSFEIDGICLDVGVSVGVAGAPDHSSAMDALIRCADAAMYVAKAAQSGCALYDPTSPFDESAGVHLGALRTALEEKQFELRYDPIHDPVSTRVVGLAARIFWDHPERGELSSEEFMPLAYNTGFAFKLNRWAFAEAIAELGRVEVETSLPLHFAMRTTDIERNETVSHLLDVLRREGWSASRLTIEWMRSRESEMSRALVENVERLRDAGVTLSLSGLGRHGLSFPSLDHVPTDRLALDASAVERAVVDERARLILASFLGLCRELSIQVTADGLRQRDMIDWLAESGCRQVRGPFFSRSIEASAVDAHVERWTA